MSDPIWITEEEVVRLLHLGEAIDALEKGLRLEAAGQAQNMDKTHLVWHGGHTLHALGATFEGAGVFGTKTWGHTAGGATPLMIVWDMNDGSLKAVIEAFALGQMRTGGISGVATRWMAEQDADDFAIIGTGHQALTQVAAVAAVRPIGACASTARARSRAGVLSSACARASALRCRMPIRWKRLSTGRRS